jgi:hypothetical protein
MFYIKQNCHEPLGRRPKGLKSREKQGAKATRKDVGGDDLQQD